MSLFLYLLVAETMSRKLKRMQDSSELKGLKIVRGVKYANHAQFVDDTILLGGASTIIAEIFKGVLSICLKASNSKVNSTKTKIYGWNCPARTMATIARTLGYEGTTKWNSFRYLGISIHKGRKKTQNGKSWCKK